MIYENFLIFMQTRSFSECENFQSFENSKNVKNTCFAPLPIQERNPFNSPKTGDLWKTDKFRLCVGDITSDGKSIYLSSNNYTIADQWYSIGNFKAIVTANAFKYSNNIA